MNKDEAIKLALEALKDCRRDPRLKYEHKFHDKVIKALEEALANHIPDDTKMVSGVKDSLTTQQEQGEPVAIYQYQMGDGSWIDQEKHSYDYNKLHAPNATVRVVYTTPQQRTWVGLDPEEIRKTNHHMVDGAYHYSFKQGAEWAEAKLKEKNT